MSWFESSDGMVTSNSVEGYELYESIIAKERDAKLSWTTILREYGVKLAHPDDGWVKRDRNTFSLSWYPQFNDNPQPGDLIAFGCPRVGEFYQPSPHTGPECAYGGYRICRVTKIDQHFSKYPGMDSTTFSYEDTGIRLPPRKPTIRRSLWRRLTRRADHG